MSTIVFPIASAAGIPLPPGSPLLRALISLGLLTIHLSIPGCASLKEKRSRLKPLLARLPRQFNVSVAEVGHQDVWQNALIAIALVSSDQRQTTRALQKIPVWIEQYWPDLTLIDDQLELF